MTGSTPVFSTPLMNADSSVRERVATLRDIDEHKEAAQLRNLLAAIVDSSDDAIIGKTLDAIIVSWNAGAERLYGYSATEVVGQPIAIIIPPDHPDELPSIMNRLKRGERIEHYETQRVRKDGTRLTVSLTISPIRDDTGTIVGASAIARDVTERRRVEAEREQLLAREQAALAEAQEALRLRDVFLSVAAHELKTPLTSLLGNTQLLQRRLEREGLLVGPHAKVTQVIVEQAQRLNKMMNALLDVSRIATGQLSIEPAPVDLCALVQCIVDEVQPALDKHTVECPLPEETVLIDGDVLRLEQVLYNLVANAIKYSPQGGPVVVRLERDGDQARIVVRDRGMGIPKTDQPQLFQRFYRASNAHSEHLSGMGIGLFVVKEIVGLHGGTVEVSSTEGEGSTFTVTMPLSTHLVAPTSTPILSMS
jgi:PAS domain S-box-containing protein